MATVTEIHREVALLVEREPSSSVIFVTLRDTALISGIPTTSTATVLRETAQLNDIATDNMYARLRAVAELNDIVTQNARIFSDMRDVAELVDIATGGVRVTETPREVAEFVDRAISEVQSTLRAVAQLNDIVTTTSVTGRVLRETARIIDRSSPSAGLTIREVAPVTGVATPVAFARTIIRELAQLNETTTSSARPSALLRETAGLTSVISSVLTVAEVIREVAFLNDRAVPPSYGRAYTCCIQTWGMSVFENFPFLRMAGNYASGDNLWRLDNATDYGTVIDSYILTGKLDMGSGTRKRMSAVYVNGSAAAPLDVTVTGEVNGVETSHIYTMELRDQANYRNNRALVGKGFRGRYMQVKIGGSGITYALVSAEADVAASERRI
jgi:hypothetical protein